MATPFDKLTSNDLTLIENYIKDYVVDAEYDTELHGEFAGGFTFDEYSRTKEILLCEEVVN